MARTIRGRRGFAAGQRRKLTWATAVGDNVSLPTGPGAAIIADLLDTYKASGGTTQGITIMRMHMQICVQTAGPVAGSGTFLGVVVGTAGDTASSINAAETYDDWMLYRRCYALGGTVGSSSAEHVYEIDLRAKRKMEELNQILWLVLEAPDDAATTVSYSARTLLALP